MKYIVIEDPSGHENIFLFSSEIKHNDMAKSLPGKVISAGDIFYEAFKDEPTTMYCTGESVNLKVRSRPLDDTALLMATLNAR